MDSLVSGLVAYISGAQDDQDSSCRMTSTHCAGILVGEIRQQLVYSNR